MKSRKERRAEARENGVAFEPQYKGRVITKAQYDKEIAELKEKQKNRFNKTVAEDITETTETTEETIENSLGE